jgi:hypothetical protein
MGRVHLHAGERLGKSSSGVLCVDDLETCTIDALAILDGPRATGNHWLRIDDFDTT